MLRRCLLMLLLVSVIVPVALAQGDYPARSDDFLNDYAKVLTAQDADITRTMLADLKTARNIEAVVVTIDSINDYATGAETIETFATGLFNAWGIGSATKNNGVLLLVAVKDRKVRIELGAGYGSGPSQEMQAVIDRYILPKFRADDYSGGIRLGTEALISKLTQQPMPETGDIVPTAVPSTSYTTPPSTRRTTDSGLEGLMLVAVGAGIVVALLQLFNGSAGTNSASNSDGGTTWSAHQSHSSDSGSSYSSTSNSYSSSDNSSSSRSDNSSSDSGGHSSGGGASGSW